MVQVLPYVPSFGEKLMPVISQSIGNIAEGYAKNRQKKNDETILQQLQNGQASPIQSTTLWGKLSPEAQKTHKPFIESQLRMQEHASKEKAKTDTKIADEARAREEFSPTVDRLEKLVHRTGAKLPFSDAFFGGVPGTQAYQERQEFDTLGFLAADKVFTHFNKGTVSKEKLAKIVEDLAPNSELTQATNRARIKALKTIVGLPSDISESKLDAIVNKSTKDIPKETVSKVEKGTKITPDLVDKLLTEANGDAAKARVKAKELGYSF